MRLNSTISLYFFLIKPLYIRPVFKYLAIVLGDIFKSLAHCFIELYVLIYNLDLSSTIIYIALWLGLTVDSFEYKLLIVSTLISL